MLNGSGIKTFKSIAAAWTCDYKSFTLNYWSSQMYFAPEWFCERTDKNLTDIVKYIAMKQRNVSVLFEEVR